MSLPFRAPGGGRGAGGAAGGAPCAGVSGVHGLARIVRSAARGERRSARSVAARLPHDQRASARSTGTGGRGPGPRPDIPSPGSRHRPMRYRGRCEGEVRPGVTEGQRVEFAGTVEIRAPREKVFAFLDDPQQVGSCGPGVESIEIVDATHFVARAKVGVGFISARFRIDAEVTERIVPERSVIKVRGQAPGSAVDALATMSLRDGAEGVTIMDWTATVTISGTIASVGARMIQGTADKMIGQTFTCIKAKLEA